MHVRENYKAQLLSHIKRINSKIVLQLRNWDKSIKLQEEHTRTLQYLSSLHKLTQDISGSVLHFCPPFPFPVLPASSRMPWPCWTSGLTGWTDQEILMLVALPDFCYRGNTQIYKLKRHVNLVHICVLHKNIKSLHCYDQPLESA